MAEMFKTIFTDKGLEKLAEATATGVALDLYQIAVGDSNGSYYEPTREQTTLINEVGRFELNSLMVEADNKKRFSAEILVPEDSGGYTIREAGLFDRAGELIAVSKVPATLKPSIESGAGSQLYFKMIGEYSTDVNITISINPRGLFVTDDVMKNYIASDVYPKIAEGDVETLLSAKSYADEKSQLIDEFLSTHINNKSNPHEITKEQIGLSNVDNTADSSKSVNYANTAGIAKTSNGLWGHTGSNIARPIDSTTWFAVKSDSKLPDSNLGGWASIDALKNFFPMLNSNNIIIKTVNSEGFTIPSGGSWMLVFYKATVYNLDKVEEYVVNEWSIVPGGKNLTSYDVYSTRYYAMWRIA